jgi:hypothetical protein
MICYPLHTINETREGYEMFGYMVIMLAVAIANAAEYHAAAGM